MTSLVWLRDDLRLDDQPAIRAAAHDAALFVYVYEPDPPGRPLGGAGRWWLDKSLAAFAAALEKIGGRLDLVVGSAEEVIPALAAHCDAAYWTHRFHKGEKDADARIAARLRESGVKVEAFNGQLLREPHEVATETGGGFKVFTPFWRKSRSLGPFEAPHPAPRKLHAAPWPKDAPQRAALADLKLHPTKPDWSAGLNEEWTPGEAGAKARLKAFLDAALDDYAEARDRLDGQTTSRLSPHLRFGEMSPRRAAAAEAAHQSGRGRGADKFLSELGWREFSHALLAQAPDLADKNWNPKFDAFPWRRDARALRAWEKGQTGYPVVDAGLRELWRTGYMHNRVRLIAGSFLTKHLRIDWREGERWFWDCLCDADDANNPANWQWIAGSGADAAPYFRVFNPMLQGAKFDPDGAYVRRWVPELAKLDARHIHAPWEAPAETLAAAGVELGKTYPHPIVEHDQARAAALAAYAEIGGETAPPPQRNRAARQSAKKSG